eukprot:CAMPEP_0197671216 /NCGR_PEP_ID=MMETSP1338-20131121/76232_1 /TAXON_ID=43686 ORGANISM="Pelagodinium beii, Strain RCC1491" /NCGR_SAMPLE_ID=MMETSP1338 /ASSEMBLY_ACC=CAM_ASM_000754 /LENGTH=35 /DNA_ID= /DNA_START= /DNA_END= /DNA_ORIENTATION=
MASKQEAAKLFGSPIAFATWTHGIFAPPALPADHR